MTNYPNLEKEYGSFVIEEQRIRIKNELWLNNFILKYRVGSLKQKLIGEGK